MSFIINDSDVELLDGCAIVFAQRKVGNRNKNIDSNMLFNADF